jgi:hypothetical protein
MSNASNGTTKQTLGGPHRQGHLLRAVPDQCHRAPEPTCGATLRGQERFQGKTFHTNNWDHTYDYRGKRVAIVGSGASAAQVIPAIAPDVEHLHVFQRTPHWVLPRADRSFGRFQRWLLG